MTGNIDRKIWLNHDLQYVLREKDIFDYTILCLNKKGINKFNLDDFFISFKKVCDKYNDIKFVTEYEPVIDNYGKLYNDKLVSYLQLFNEKRNMFYNMIKKGDFKRYEGSSRNRSSALSDLFECGFGIYKPEKDEVVSVFGKIFSQKRADYLIEHIDSGLEEIFDEVAQGIIENKKEREEGENSVNK